MKLAILSDIHGNLPALQAVSAHLEAWRPDHTIVAGDIVNRGPSSLQCWRFLRDRPGWRLIRGNQEDYVLEWARSDAAPGDLVSELNRSSYWTFRQLGDQVASLDALPDELSYSAPDGSQARICHASVRGNRDGIGPKAPPAQVRQQIAPAPALFGTAHVHIPFVRSIDETLLVNSGAVGCPCDGDRRASYAQIEWSAGGGWRACILRLPYDRAQAERDFAGSSFFPGSGPLGPIIFHGWRLARPLLAYWVRQYQDQVLAGEIELQPSVALFLDQWGLKAGIIRGLTRKQARVRCLSPGAKNHKGVFNA